MLCEKLGPFHVASTLVGRIFRIIDVVFTGWIPLLADGTLK